MVSWNDINDVLVTLHYNESCLSHPGPRNFIFLTDSSDETIRRAYFIMYPNLISMLEWRADAWRAVMVAFGYVNLPFAIETEPLSREQMLLYERMRTSYCAISHLSAADSRIVFSYSGTTFFFADVHGGSEIVSNVDENNGAAKIDPKLCPYNKNLLAYIYDGNLYLTYIPTKTVYQLTFVREGNQDGGTSAGTSSFILAEEFDRFSGYWWQPVDSNDGIYRILYDEEDESCVDLVDLCAYSDGYCLDDAFSAPESECGPKTGVETSNELPLSNSSGPITKKQELIRYPKAGKCNSRSNLKLVQFKIIDNEIREIESLAMQKRIQELYPWCEYLTMAGWYRDPSMVWFKIMNRKQNLLKIVLVPVDYFGKCNATSAPRVIYTETSDFFIPSNNVLHFLPCNDHETVEFLCANSQSGFSHFFLQKVSLTGSTITEPDVLEVRQITSGDWCCLLEKYDYDEKHDLLYFHALKDTCLESHLYMTKVKECQSKIIRLTDLGFSHTTYLDHECLFWIEVRSSFKEQFSSRLCKMLPSDQSFDKCQNFFVTSGSDDSFYPKYKLFNFPASDGTILYGCITYPFGFEEKKLYPTLLYVYGGPEIQTIRNCYSLLREHKLHMFSRFGFCTLMIDNRGTGNRGTEFAKHLRNRLGKIEIEDQLAGLFFAANRFQCIDLTRVAIYGSSYGGFLSMYALTERPDIFKVAISVSAATMWELYDSAYTERYLGLPDENPEGYKASSLLNRAHLFPDDKERLLIIHGLLDENVHFEHTKCLVDELDRLKKPYRLQVYRNERHGFRNRKTLLHCETLMIKFLLEKV